MIGQTMLHYEIAEKVGAGGMGEVYRARDTKLGRDVALKILPDAFSQDPERLARFEREAQLLASLNHTHIASIYGLEQSNTTRFLVLEFVGGEDLAERLLRGPIPMSETIDICRQIAEALEEAHENRVVHRDLKPANIKVDPDGKVKVLDFGLAKALEADTGDSSSNLTQSPTLMTSGTVEGVILGTAAYMSPEQARGKRVDRRSDIFSFGCVMFEMLTGRQTFSGETVSDTLAAVLRAEPEWELLPGNTPPVLERLLRRCLDKNPERRLRDIGESRIVLQDIQSGVADIADTGWPTPPQHWFRRYGGWIVSGILAAALTATMVRSPDTPKQTVALAIHFAVPQPPDNSFRFTVSDNNNFAPPVISPDGRRIVFGTNDATLGLVLWLRDLDQAEPRRIDGSNDAHLPFWSPDGRHLGFVADGTLRTLPVEGGAARVVCDIAGGSRGAAWSNKGVIVFAQSSNSALFAVPEAGGTPTPITTIDSTIADISHRWPSFLPDGRRFLFTVWTNSEKDQARAGGIFVGSLDGGKQTRLLTDASSAIYVAATLASGTGHLLFCRDQTLLAVPFDAEGEEIVGAPVTVIEDVQFDALTGRAIIDVAPNGTIVYRAASATAASQLEWLDRSGKTISTLGEPNNYWHFRLSPDAKHLVSSITNPNGSTDMWMMDIDRNISSRFTFGPSSVWSPVWSPDHRQIVFTSDVNGVEDAYIKPADGSGERRILIESDTQKRVEDWSRDGRFVLYSELPAIFNSEDKDAIWVLDTETEETEPLLTGGSNFSAAWFSPDSRWIAYVSDESGRQEVYIRPFSEKGGRWQISSAGGSDARWRDDGAEIIYRSPSQEMMAVPIEFDSTGVIIPGTSRKLFSLSGIRAWDITGDHERILIARVRHDLAATPILVSVNWADNFSARQSSFD